ncbi:kinase/ transmembrane receptor protein kinase [Vigna unguiculata]|uniref:Kinase/ transmembrane receptor protein kinase n=1 Tax=Vigna unguiculata TaxID=3917 RepID=A0A4D6MC80_VIGUN|nr:kinase/ transmembrane receptor protein kinase [Vigna unguiculata]
MAYFISDPTSFCWAVDSAIRSETASSLGASPPHSFASVVDYALRSSCASEADFGTSRVPSFGSGVDYVIRSSYGGGTDFETFPVPGFPSEVYSTTVAEESSPVLSYVTEHAVKGLRLFSQAELAAATNNFSLHNKIGAGRLGVVYKGKLVDGREVAIKRGETWRKEKTSSVISALTYLSRLHHRHLVGLVGFCEEKYERMLVYEYMKNGTLYDHLHENGSNVLNSWKMRINIALDASRGIEYLHKYAVPLFIHGDIKSSNILLDGSWMAKVSDFKMCLMSGEAEGDYRGIKVGGTVGYIDPEYYDLNMLTAKSDVNVLNSWKMRINIALDASRGIEYLHKYAVPLFIHGDIKSSNILLDGSWMAKVSDFKMCLRSGEAEGDYRGIKVGGTVGYIDPEYYDLNMLTAKSDVYGLGVVLLELLTGKRAIFLDGENGGNTLLSVHRLVDFAVPTILDGELVNILDCRVGAPGVNEIQALELVAQTAIHCVNRKGKDRPSMTDIVATLETALAICYGRSYHRMDFENIVWKYKR